MARLLVLVTTMLPAVCLIYVQIAKSSRMLANKLCVVSHQLPSPSLDFASSSRLYRDTLPNYFTHLRKHSELGYFLSLEMHAEEQAILGEDQGDGVQ